MRGASAIHTISSIKKWAIYLSPTVLLAIIVYASAYQPPIKPAPVSQNPFSASNQSPYTVVPPKTPAQPTVKVAAAPAEPLPVINPLASTATIDHSSTTAVPPSPSSAHSSSSSTSARSYQARNDHNNSSISPALNLIDRTLSSTSRSVSNLLPL